MKDPKIEALREFCYTLADNDVHALIGWMVGGISGNPNAKIADEIESFRQHVEEKKAKAAA